MLNGQPAPEFRRYRKVFLSLDIDLTRIRTRRQWLHTVLSTLNMVKIPFPAIEYNPGGTLRFHPFFF
jgi:hypothetical protein